MLLNKWGLLTKKFIKFNCLYSSIIAFEFECLNPSAETMDLLIK